MFGIRFFIIIAALILVVVIINRLRTSPKPGNKPPATPANMVQCAHCGLYLPREDAVQSGSDTFCSIAHRDLHDQS